MDDHRRKHHAEHGDGAQRGRHGAEHLFAEAAHRDGAVLVANAHRHRHEGGIERAFGEQAPEQVRNLQRREISVRQRARAQHGSDAGIAQEAEQARRQGGGADGGDIARKGHAVASESDITRDARGASARERRSRAGDVATGRLPAIVRDHFSAKAASSNEPFMTAVRYDVLGLGNAIVDVITRADDDFLLKHAMRKGSMSLIDEARAAQIYDAMGPAVEISGGSAANTIVGAAGFGARAAFIGRVKDDPLGTVFAHDIRAAGVAFDTAPSAAGPSTGRCYVLVTPDGERTMNTFLGAAQDLHPRDIDDDMVASAAITYLEGYLWDPPHAKEAFLKAAAVAHEAKRLVALTLSDAFCVDRWRDEFLHLLRSGTVDLLFSQ